MSEEIGGFDSETFLVYSCQDVVRFTDGLGYGCGNWVGYDCTNYAVRFRLYRIYQINVVVL